MFVESKYIEMAVSRVGFPLFIQANITWGSITGKVLLHEVLIDQQELGGIGGGHSPTMRVRCPCLFPFESEA